MKTLVDLINDIRHKSEGVKKLTEMTPRIMGEACIKVIKSNFKAQGYEGGQWDTRKAVTDKSYTYGRKKKGKSQYKGSVFSPTRPILVQTGNLRDSITFEVSGKYVQIGVLANSPQKNGEDSHTYAKHLNEGGAGKWGKNTTHTVARQFMPKPGEPPTAKMLTAINKKLDYETKQIMAGWEK